MTGVTAVLIGLGVLVVGVLVGVGLVAWALVSVVRDDVDPDNSPTIQRIEAEHPVMHDLEIDTGTRIRYKRSGGEPGLISLSYATGSLHVQEFAPNSGWTLDDVALEIVERAEAEGYELVQDGDGWCSATHDETALEHMLEIEIVTSDPLPGASHGFALHVTVWLSSTRC